MNGAFAKNFFFSLPFNVWSVLCVVRKVLEMFFFIPSMVERKVQQKNMFNNSQLISKENSCVAIFIKTQKCSLEVVFPLVDRAARPASGCAKQEALHVFSWSDALFWRPGYWTERTKCVKWKSKNWRFSWKRDAHKAQRRIQDFSQGVSRVLTPGRPWAKNLLRIRGFALKLPEICTNLKKFLG